MNTNSNPEDKKNKQPRGAKRRARTRADLLAAARKVFARRGYHDASILDITEEADVGVGTFYLHFRDKDEAFNTLIDEVLSILEKQVIREIRSHGHFSLTDVVRSILVHAYAERDLFRIALTGGGQITRTMRVEDMIAQGLTRALEQLEDQDLLKGFDIPLLARLITGIISQGIIWWFDQDEPDPERMAEQILRLLSQGLPAALFQNVFLSETPEPDHEA